MMTVISNRQKIISEPVSTTKNSAIIFVGEKSEPMAIAPGRNQITIATAPNPSSAAELATKLVDNGADRIELCGGASTRWLVKVHSAVPENIPVGLVTYPFESLERIAAYKAKFESGEVAEDDGSVFIIKTDEANPAVDRITTEGAGGWTEYIAVSDKQEASDIAAELTNKGAALIELYGGFDLSAVDLIHNATNGKVPIGIAVMS